VETLTAFIHKLRPALQTSWCMKHCMITRY